MPRIAYVNGEFVPIEQARISILDRGFVFADGVYEVTAVLGGGLVDNAHHLTRLRRSLAEIALACPVAMPELTRLELDLVRRNALAEGGVYLQITRGAADREFAFPAAEVAPSLVMFTQARQIVDSPDAKSGIAVKSVADIRWRRRDIKSVALLAQVLAKQEAVAAGCREAWMIEDGYVTEGASSSAFIIAKEGAIIARPQSHDILPGVTRKSVLALAAEENLAIEERRFTLAEAYDAAEAFNSSASGFVMPVVSIDGKPIGDGAPGPLTKRLRELYIAHARETATYSA
jgi:D-alanine transaminase